jgi:hypothetical protein
LSVPYIISDLSVPVEQLWRKFNLWYKALAHGFESHTSRKAIWTGVPANKSDTMLLKSIEHSISWLSLW